MMADGETGPQEIHKTIENKSPSRTHLGDGAGAGDVLGLDGDVRTLHQVVRTLAHEVVASPVEGGVVRVAYHGTARPTLDLRARPFTVQARTGKGREREME